MSKEDKQPNKYMRTRTTVETKKLRDKMLAMHPTSPSWREAVISMYRDELRNFIDMATTPYKRVLFEKDWEYMRGDLRGLLNKPIILNAALGY